MVQRRFLYLLALHTLLHCIGCAHDADIDSLRAALTQEPNDFDLNRQLAALLTAEGKHADAIKHWAACLRERPGDNTAWDEHVRLKRLVREASAASREGGNAVSERALGKERPWATPEELKAPGWMPSLEGFKRLYQDAKCPCHGLARAALQGYKDFFQHISLRKGWRTVPFTLSDLQDIFQVAAEVVGLMRTRLDGLGRGFTIRQVAGSSHELLWSLTKNPRIDQPGQSAEYVLETLQQLVVSTFSDANGLVEGLDKKLIIQCVHAHPWVNQILRSINS